MNHLLLRHVVSRNDGGGEIIFFGYFWITDLIAFRHREGRKLVAIEDLGGRDQSITSCPLEVRGWLAAAHFSSAAEVSCYIIRRWDDTTYRMRFLK